LIATKFNIKPIKGRTLLFCNVDDSMARPCQTAKGFGKPMTFEGFLFSFPFFFKKKKINKKINKKRCWSFVRINVYLCL